MSLFSAVDAPLVEDTMVDAISCRGDRALQCLNPVFRLMNDQGEAQVGQSPSRWARNEHELVSRHRRDPDALQYTVCVY